MTSIFALINNSQKLSKFLFGYWLITPILFMIYVWMTAQSSGTEFKELLNQPTVAIAFLIACMTLIMAGMLKLTQRENPNTTRLFAIYAAVQQLLVGNLVGVLFSYFLVRALRFEQRERFAPAFRWVLVGGMALIGFLSILVLMIALNALRTH